MAIRVYVLYQNRRVVLILPTMLLLGVMVVSCVCVLRWHMMVIYL